MRSATLAIFALMLTITVSAPAQAAAVIYEEEFDGFSLGAIGGQFGWMATSGAPQISGGSDRVVVGNGTGTVTATHTGLFNFGTKHTEIIISAEMRLRSGFGNRIHVVDATGTPIVGFGAGFGGNDYVVVDGTGANVFEGNLTGENALTGGHQWFDVRFTVQFNGVGDATGTFEVDRDGDGFTTVVANVDLNLTVVNENPNVWAGLLLELRTPSDAIDAISVSAVPEPSTGGLLMVGLAGVIVRRRRRELARLAASAARTLARPAALAILIGLALGTASTAQAALITFKQGLNGYTGTEDTTLIQNASNNNYGGRTQILVGPTGAGQVRTGLIRFDVSGLNNAATILSAKLRLNVNLTAANATFNVFRIDEANIGWVEGTVNGVAQTGSSSWSRRVFNTTNWAGSAGAETSGTDFYSGSLGAQSLTAGSTPVGTWVEWDLNPSGFTLTEMFNSWSATSSNPGLLIRRSGQLAQWGFVSSEGTFALRPELVVTLVPEPSSGGLLALGLVGMLVRRRRVRK